MEKFYNLKEVAEILNVNRETLRRWDRSGKFPSTRHPINNYRVYPSSKVNQLVKELHPFHIYKISLLRLFHKEFLKQLFLMICPNH